MADTIRFQHMHFEGDWMEYFYDGELPVRDRVIEVPADRYEWCQRVWILGFRLDMDGNHIDDLEAHYEREKARDAKEIDASEGANAGGLPADQDRVRARTAKSSRSVPRRRVGSRSGNGSRSRTKLRSKPADQDVLPHTG